MSPQLFQQMTIQQQEKVISVTQAQVDAKQTEVAALSVLSRQLPFVITDLVPWDTKNIDKPALQDAIEDYCDAKHAQAVIELEQLQLTLLALKQMQSPIVGARFK